MSLNVEDAVLGVCVAVPATYWQIADILSPEDFEGTRHRKLLAIIRERARADEPFDAITLGDVNQQLGQFALDLANGEGWRRANIRAYAEMVAANAVTRRVKFAAQQILHLTGADVIGEAQRLIGECLPRQSGSVKHIGEYVRASVLELQKRVDAKGTMFGLPTSLPGLDDMLCGYQPGDLIVVAARPSVGKTAFAVQSLVNAARHRKHCLMFSLEMTGVKIADRVQAHIAQVNAAGMKRPELFDQADFGALFNAAAEVMELPLHIDATPGLTVEALCARARQLHAIQPLDLVAIDYLTQMTPPRANTVNEALQIVTRSLKALAKELNVPVILLSQLNREAEGHRPHLSNLRDTGALEQDADVVIFLHRPDEKKRDHVLLIVAKQRDGEIGDIHLDSNMRHQRFTEMEEPRPSTAKERPAGMADYVRRSRTVGGWNGDHN